MYIEGFDSFVKLQPGHRQELEATVVSSLLLCSAGIMLELLAHCRTQLRWKIVQHVVQDQTLEFLTTSAVHIAHSYCLLSISSWSRVRRSAAVDLDGRLFFALSRCEVEFTRSAGEACGPGAKSGALARRDDGLVSSTGFSSPTLPFVRFSPNWRPPGTALARCTA